MICQIFETFASYIISEKRDLCEALLFQSNKVNPWFKNETF